MKARSAKGILLEEVMLFLLARSGFDVVLSAGTDRSLVMGPAGLCVQGRGCTHQADAVADFRVHMPFGNPTRLIVEAKCYTKPVGIAVVRNAVGVLKDIGEFYTPSPAGQSRARYHYRYVVVSATSFAGPAEAYAFAHDTPLVPLGRSVFMRPVLRAIDAFQDADVESIRPGGTRRLRESLRRRFEPLQIAPHRDLDLPRPLDERLEFLADAVRSIGSALLVHSHGNLPLLLTPRAPEVMNQIREERDLRVEMYFEPDAWYITDTHGNRLFSFDLPPQLFEQYAAAGILHPTSASDLKTQQLSELQGFITEGEQIRLVTLRLDRDWVDRVLDQVAVR